MSERERLWRRGGTMASLLFLSFALVVLIFVSGHGVATYKMWRARSAWERTLGNWEEVGRLFPRSDTNATALEVERLAALLGIDVRPHGLAGGARPDATQARDWKRHRGAIAGYMSALIRRETRGSTAPPAEAAEFLRRQRATLDELETLLAADEPPRWASDYRRLLDAPIPNLLGQLELQRVLLADGLAALAGEDRDAALEALETSWRLASSLEQRPALSAQLVRSSILRWQAGVLRQIGDVPGSWRERLEATEPRQALIQAVKFDGWTWAQSMREGSAEQSLVPRDPLGRALWPIVGPYTRIALADVGELTRRNAELLEELGPLCDSNLDEVLARLQVEIPGWNKIGAVIFNDLSGVMSRLAHLEFDLEMTRKILELDARSGKPGASIEGRESSVCCPADHWIYSIGADGSRAVRFGRDTHWSDSDGASGGGQGGAPATSFAWKR